MLIPATAFSGFLNQIEYFSKETWQARLAKAEGVIPEYLIGCVELLSGGHRWYDGVALHRTFTENPILVDPETQEKAKKISFFVLKLPVTEASTLDPYAIEDKWDREAHHSDLAVEYPLELGRYQWILYKRSSDASWLPCIQRNNPQMLDNK